MTPGNEERCYTVWGFAMSSMISHPIRTFVNRSHGTSLDGVTSVNVRIWFIRPIKYGFFLLSNFSFSSLCFHTRYWLKFTMRSFIVPFRALL